MFTAHPHTLTLEIVQARARERGCRCLATSYSNAHTPMWFVCLRSGCGEQFETSANRLTNGNGCPSCHRNRVYSIVDLQKEAKDRGGTLLSPVYVDANTRYRWQCGFGHESWKATWHQVNNGGTWCPRCTRPTAFGERICRQIFEALLSAPCPPEYPPELRSLRGVQLELDGYCPSARVAFEHQGGHHTKEDHVFHASPKSWEYRCSNDRIKRTWCESQEITLIEVPEIPAQLAIADAEGFIRDALAARNVTCSTRRVIIDKAAAYAGADPQQEHRELSDMVERLHHGRLMSPAYLGSREKLEWKCRVHKHPSWWAAPYSIKAGNWCRVCAGRAPDSVETFQRIAEIHRCRLDSLTYRNQNDRLQFTCLNCLASFARTAVNVKMRGLQCPSCGDGWAPCTLEAAAAVAATHEGGRVIEAVPGKGFRWGCRCGYTWVAQLAAVRRRRWCAQCAKNVRLDAPRIAARRPDWTLVTPAAEYRNAHQLLDWQCGRGHSVKAKVDGIEHAACRQCDFQDRLSAVQALTSSLILHSTIHPGRRSKWEWDCRQCGHHQSLTIDQVKYDPTCRQCGR